MKIHRISSEFGRQCQSLLDGYKERLRQASSDYTLAAYCKESGVDYHKVIGWTSRHGYYVRNIKSEVFGMSPSDVPGPCETFVQFMPGPGSSPRSGASLKGVSIDFPDGVSLRLEECNSEGVITLLETYERRRAARGGGMFSLEASRRYFMCQHPVNMRKGIDSLFNLIQAESPLSPMSGDVFVFFSKNRQSVKLLRWDTDGFLLYQKRLERGSFEMPRINPSTGYYELSWETFSFIMSGVSLESVRFRKRYRTRFAGI